MAEYRTDADLSVFFAKENEKIKAKTFDTKNENLKATMLIPISQEASPSDRTITYRRYTNVGTAKIISHYADDVPRSDVYGEEKTIKIYRVASGYGYDVDEVRSAASSGKNLEQRRANSAKRASDEKIDSIAWFGDKEYNIQGFVDYPGIPREDSAGDGTGGLTTLKSKTPELILDTLNNWVNGVIERTNGLEAPDTMLLPIEQYTYLATKRLGDSSDETILSYFMKTNLIIKNVEWVTQLKGAGRNGTDRGVIYTRSPDTLSLELPLIFTTLPPEREGFGYTVDTEAKIAGVNVYYPLACAYLDGI